jgi:hypothetical protein
MGSALCAEVTQASSPAPVAIECYDSTGALRRIDIAKALGARTAICLQDGTACVAGDGLFCERDGVFARIPGTAGPLTLLAASVNPIKNPDQTLVALGEQGLGYVVGKFGVTTLTFDTRAKFVQVQSFKDYWFARTSDGRLAQGTFDTPAETALCDVGENVLAIAARDAPFGTFVYVTREGAVASADGWNPCDALRVPEPVLGIRRHVCGISLNIDTYTRHAITSFPGCTTIR